MRPVIVRGLLLVCVALLAVSPATAASSVGDDCHAAFSYYLGVQPYIVNPAAAGREAATIVAVFEHAAATDPGAVSYRITARGAASGKVVRSWAGGVDSPLGASAEAVVTWDGLDDRGLPVASGEYVIDARATRFPGRRWSRELENDGAGQRTALQAEGSEIRVVIDREGRYDILFDPGMIELRRANAERASIDTIFPSQLLYGSTHPHRIWSDGGMRVPDCVSGRHGHAGGAQPVDAYNYAKTTGQLDFLAVVEHNHLMQDACSTCSAQQIKDRYASGFAAAQSATVPGSFVGIFGMEWGVISGGGHVNVYNQAKLMSWTGEPFDVDTPKSDYPALYSAMAANQGALGSYGTFNHPNSSDFGSWARSANGDATMRGLSIISGPAFNTSTSFSPGGSTYGGLFNSTLSKGWKVAPEAHQDNHCWNFGNSTPNRTVALIPNGTTFNQASLMAAYGARRFYSTQDMNAQLAFRTSDGARVMGESFSAGASVPVSVSLTDADGEGGRRIGVWGGKAGTVASPGAAAAVVASNTATGTLSASLTPQGAGEEWYYYVIAVQADGNTLWSAPMWITWSSCSAPATPAPASPASGATAVPVATTLSWASVSGATSYDVYFGTATSPALYQNVTGTSVAVSSLANSTAYYWNVVAKNSCGASAASATRSFTTEAASCSAPATPALSSPAAGATGVATSTSLSWAAVSGATSYDVYFGTTTSPALYQNVTGTSVALTGLTNSTTYSWYVRAKNACGASAAPATRSFTTTAPPAGSTPIACGDSLGGTLATSDVRSTVRTTSYADLFTFTGTVGSTVTITMNSTAVDAYLVLKSSAGTVLAQDDDSNGGSNSKITYAITAAGTYTVEATTYYADTVGAYTVALACSAPPVALINEGAESGATGWTFEKNSGSGWAIETSTDSKSGAKRFKTNVGFATYLDGADWKVVSPSFSLTGKTSATLTFWNKYKTESSYDFVIVEVSTNGGTSWTQLSKVSGTSTSYPSWTQRTQSLTAYAGQASVKIRFRFTSDGSVNDWGLAVDDVVVTAQ